jgi:hypothetical protein
MLTRRQVLSGTAAASIAAIASARGVASAAPEAEAGFDEGFGNLQDGAAAAFHKERLGFSFFVKLHDSAAQVFYKESTAGQIGVFLKQFQKFDVAGAAFHKVQWQLVDQFGGFLKDVGAEAGFLKLDSTLAQIFLKYENSDHQLAEDVRTLQNGLLVPAVDECRSQIG